MALALAACASDEDDVKEGALGFVVGFLGGVAADEPRAALIGREVLSAGGSAADAAVAVYFALSVTLPSSASLGGGGVCVVHDNPSATTKALDFLARAPAATQAAARPSAVPGNPRGFFELHSKYGRLRWEQLVSPAERKARFGIQVSRAFARDLAAVEQALMAETEARRIFGKADGTGLVGEGDFLTQTDLAAVLGRLRSLKPGDFYSGRFAGQLAAAAREAGGTLTPEDLRRYIPLWRDTIQIPFGYRTVHFAPPPAAAGGVAAEMWAMLAHDDLYEDGGEGERTHLLIETAMRAFADRGQWLRADGTSAADATQLASEARIASLMASYSSDRHLPAAQLNPAPISRPENPAATSFVVIDREGSAVACALTMNNLFGTGRIAPGTGILLAALPGQGGRGPMSLGPMVVVKHNVNELLFAAAASGGVAAPTAMINVAARVLIGEQPLEAAMSAKRVHHSGDPDLTYYEEGFGEAAIQDLTRRGHQSAATAPLGLLNAASCPGGIPPKPESCVVRVDPRGFGLAVSADE